MTRPQVLTLTAGAQSVHLDTHTVALALAAMGRTWGRVTAPESEALATLRAALTEICGPDHLAAVLPDDGTTDSTSTTTTED